MSAPKLSVVILTRGDPALIQGCFRSLEPELKGVDAQVIVVEHESDDCGEWIKDAKPDLPCLTYESRKNELHGKQSYSSLNNHGASISKGKYLLLLNNDTFIRKGAIKAMMDAMEAHEDAGVVGAKLLFPNRKIQHLGVSIDAYGVPSHVGYGRADSASFEAAHRDDYFDAVTFACVLIRRDLWDTIGGLDEDYFFNYEDIDFCLKVQEQGLRCFVAMKAVVTHYEGQAGEYRNTPDHSRDKNFAVYVQKWISTGRINHLPGMKIVGRDAIYVAGPRNLRRIAIIPASMDHAVPMWRLLWPAKRIIKKNLAQLHIVDGLKDADKLMSIVEHCDVAIWQGNYTESLKRMAQAGDYRAHRMIYELDDHPIYLSPFSRCYWGLGTQEITMTAKDGSQMWLWRDGQEGFNVTRNRDNLARQLEIMSLVDAVTTTTEPLAEYFRTMNHRVYELPNCLPFDLFPPVWERYKRRGEGPIRIAYWGGDNHFHDVNTIGAALVKYINEPKHDVFFTTIGSYYRGALKGIDENKAVEEPWVHSEAWPWRLATSGFDIALVPLAPPNQPFMKFNHYKSEIKWLEAAAYKIPCLVQAGVAPYKNCQDGVNAMTYTTMGEFTEKLDQLCRDPELRARIGQNAHDWAREHRDLDKNLHLWVEAWEEVAGLQETFEIPDVPEEELEPARPNAISEGAGGI